VNTASAALPPQTKSAVQQSVRQSVYNDFITGLTQDAGVKINQQVLDQALALDQNGQ